MCYITPLLPTRNILLLLQPFVTHYTFPNTGYNVIHVSSKLVFLKVKQKTRIHTFIHCFEPDLFTSVVFLTHVIDVDVGAHTDLWQVCVHMT